MLKKTLVILASMCAIFTARGQYEEYFLSETFSTTRPMDWGNEVVSGVYDTIDLATQFNHYVLDTIHHEESPDTFGLWQVRKTIDWDIDTIGADTLRNHNGDVIEITPKFNMTPIMGWIRGWDSIGVRAAWDEVIKTKDTSEIMLSVASTSNMPRFSEAFFIEKTKLVIKIEGDTTDLRYTNVDIKASSGKDSIIKPLYIGFMIKNVYKLSQVSVKYDSVAKIGEVINFNITTEIRHLDTIPRVSLELPSDSITQTDTIYTKRSGGGDTVTVIRTSGTAYISSKSIEKLIQQDSTIIVESDSVITSTDSTKSLLKSGGEPSRIINQKILASFSAKIIIGETTIDLFNKPLLIEKSSVELMETPAEETTTEPVVTTPTHPTEEVVPVVSEPVVIPITTEPIAMDPQDPADITPTIAQATSDEEVQNIEQQFMEGETTTIYNMLGQTIATIRWSSHTWHENLKPGAYIIIQKNIVKKMTK